MNVKELRAKAGLSQSQFAVRFGIPVRTLQEWEQGRQAPPSYVVSMMKELLAPGIRQEEVRSKELTVKAPKDIDCDMKQWPARYTVEGAGDARIVRIESRSAIDVVAAKIVENGLLGPQENYYISSPNFGVAIPSIPSLQETYWITEKLLSHEMPAPDAVTVAQVLRDLGDF